MDCSPLIQASPLLFQIFSQSHQGGLSAQKHFFTLPYLFLLTYCCLIHQVLSFYTYYSHSPLEYKLP